MGFGKGKLKNFHPKTEFKKGEHRSQKTEFKKGNKNRYIDGRSFVKSEYGQGKNPNSRKGGFKRGNKHPLYSGKCKVYELIRKYAKYREWTLKCMNRDNFSCRGCENKQNLEVHHRKLFSQIIKEYDIKTLEESDNCLELWDISNGITLCLDCHSIVDKFRRRTNGNVAKNIN
jgi:hypothetical protein